MENICLGFGEKTLLEMLNLRVAEGDRIGLIGANGSGKSSLLRVLAGEQSVDSGCIRAGRGTRVGYLPQDLEQLEDKTLWSLVRDGIPGREELKNSLAAAEQELEQLRFGLNEVNGAQEAAFVELASRISALHERLAHYDLHFTDHQAQRVLAGLGFTPADRDRPLAELSGGWQMRAKLALLLFQQPDLLLLDEPTNHLDMPSVAWFADFLRRYPRAFILVCHDREFLNEQIKRVVSLEPEGARQYPGDYEAYLRRRAEEKQVLQNAAENIRREREQAERFITRFRAQASKARAVQSRIKALEKMPSVETLQERSVMHFKFPPCARAGR